MVAICFLTSSGLVKRRSWGDTRRSRSRSERGPVAEGSSAVWKLVDANASEDDAASGALAALLEEGEGVQHGSDHVGSKAENGSGINTTKFPLLFGGIASKERITAQRPIGESG